jgi:hypothetical protein
MMKKRGYLKEFASLLNSIIAIDHFIGCRELGGMYLIKV